MAAFQYHTLSNGIRLVHKYVDSIVAHCGIIINTGSRDEELKEQGLAHFIEHVIFKGTSKRKSYYILSSMENVGGELNAFTTKEETCIYSSFLPQYYQRAIELTAEITFDSIFPEKELEKEKDVVIDEINSYKDSPSEEIFDDFEDLIFDGHSIGRNILGTPKNLKKFNKKSILDFIEKNYHTDQIVISSAGKIEFSKLIKLVEKSFGSIKEKCRDYQREVFTNYVPKTLQLKKKTFQTHCMIGNIAYSSMEEKKTGLILLNNILGGPGMNSRLSLAIREKYGFCYNIESNYTPYSDTGFFSIYLGTDNDFVEKTVHLVYQELKKFREQKLGTLQLSRAKQQMLGQIAISYESNLNEMLSMGKSLLVFNKVDSIEEIHSKINALKSDEILEVANEVFDKEKLSVLLFNSK
ncbi:MAG: insulinase family protein [Bacteroidetes bacterium]|nr:insulinase family protein [Bacteroidota bacterium]